jgi:hypothetical protein
MKTMTHFHIENPLHLTLKQLEEHAEPKWGRMTPQHMVEHLTTSVRQSNGKEIVNPAHPQERLDRAKAFMLSDRPFPKNAGTNAENPAPLPPLRNKSLEEAKAELLKELEDYKAHHQTDRGRSYAHTVFGHLNKEEWDAFHDKHFRHHFTQFGLLDEE